ncbi:MAG TPA: helix-turn-helix domain-containing protein [Ktedonobacterales bacterium]|jgi:transposase|nr:helix-turn-helix domain-containing protein [Ktedonobacterales bacterium]
MTLRLRPLTEEEQGKIARLVRVQRAPVRLVRRAQIIAWAAAGLTVPAIAHRLSLSEKAVRRWLKRFETESLAGVDDAPRSGRPHTYSPDITNQVIAKARRLPPKPADWETAPLCHWTLDRLQVELAKDGIPNKRSQIRRILKAEHFKWQQSRTWLESTDPAFAEEREPSSISPPLTPIRRPTAP